MVLSGISTCCVYLWLPRANARDGDRYTRFSLLMGHMHRAHCLRFRLLTTAIILGGDVCIGVALQRVHGDEIER